MWKTQNLLDESKPNNIKCNELNIPLILLKAEIEISISLCDLKMNFPVCTDK